jgi:hypothetical protein
MEKLMVRHHIHLHNMNYSGQCMGFDVTMGVNMEINSWSQKHVYGSMSLELTFKIRSADRFI